MLTASTTTIIFIIGFSIVSKIWIYISPKRPFHPIFRRLVVRAAIRRWSNKPDVVGSIPVTTEFFLISCDSNQVPKWFGTHYNLDSGGPILTLVKWCYCAGKSVFGVAPAIVQLAHYVAYVYGKMPPSPSTTTTTTSNLKENECFLLYGSVFLPLIFFSGSEYPLVKNWKQ